MSKMSGDQARFNRVRKHRVHLRERARLLRAEIEKRAAEHKTLKPKA